MTQVHSLQFALLRPAIIHSLRAAGFYGARPSVVDTLTDLCARFLILIASRTADFANDRLQETTELAPEEEPSTTEPTLADVRNALSSVAFFVSSVTPSEEHWRELLRKPLSTYPRTARDKIRQQRNTEDVADVKDFVDWATGPVAKETRRIAGLAQEDSTNTGPMGSQKPPDPPTNGAATAKEDYLAHLKKKHGKGGGEGSRFSGTILGQHVEDRVEIRLEGGPASLKEWVEAMSKPSEPEISSITTESVDSTSKKRKASYI